MDDGFLLDEFNEEQFESLLDNAADQLPVRITISRTGLKYIDTKI